MSYTKHGFHWLLYQQLRLFLLLLEFDFKVLLLSLQSFVFAANILNLGKRRLFIVLWFGLIRFSKNSITIHPFVINLALFHAFLGGYVQFVALTKLFTCHVHFNSPIEIYEQQPMINLYFLFHLSVWPSLPIRQTFHFKLFL
jgi:hypothetical protein